MCLGVSVAMVFLAAVVWVLSEGRGDGKHWGTHRVLLRRVGGLRQQGHARHGLTTAVAEVLERLVPAARARLKRDKAYFRDRSGERDERE
jgi:hypothetical protein